MKFHFERLRETDYLDESLDLAVSLAERGFYWGEGNRHDDAILWAYTPVARVNAFQALLYKKAWKHGIAPLGILNYRQLVELPWPGITIVHLHWLAGITKDATTKMKAKQRVKEFAEILARCKEQGKFIVWTVHNIVPHDSEWLDEDITSRQIISDAADVIHIMTKETLAATSGHFSIDTEKVVFCKHPLYSGVYSSHIERDEARFQLGLTPEHILFVCFGAIMKYKGLYRLMDAFEAAQHSIEGQPLRLLIAGYPSDQTLAGCLEDWARGRDDVLLRLIKIPDTEVPYLFSAADFAVCPYEKTLNSGSGMLAMTYRVPVIGPRCGAFKDNLPESLRYLFEPNNTESLTEALIKASNAFANIDYKCTIGRELDALSADTISDQFIINVLNKLGLRTIEPCINHEHS